MEAAWTTAMLGRTKKPIPLKNLLSEPERKPVRQSWQTMYAACAYWAGSAGEILPEGQAA